MKVLAGQVAINAVSRMSFYILRNFKKRFRQTSSRMPVFGLLISWFLTELIGLHRVGFKCFIENLTVVRGNTEIVLINLNRKRTKLESCWKKTPRPHKNSLNVWIKSQITTHPKIYLSIKPIAIPKICIKKIFAIQILFIRVCQKIELCRITANVRLIHQ